MSGDMSNDLSQDEQREIVAPSISVLDTNTVNNEEPVPLSTEPVPLSTDVCSKKDKMAIDCRRRMKWWELGKKYGFADVMLLDDKK